ncbi:calcium/sodium antiporter [Shewanella sp. Scap07]|uniref:calcium/sodium antiporter n=1 Tax=Shewanella sp. Scap07 TaxID=2589987 RepID=UPI0015B7DCE1|nr:calcium/sodium antiporter [Shewanella sp. Scap07]QLE87274.1 calcium/sodium antiporter [Shewanella sp. Scap07]
MWIALSIIAGFIILTLGAEALVKGASQIALKLGITPLVIGLTIVAFGTSAPEFAVSIKAALADNADIAIGNVLGSNIANIGLILAITALIKPIRVKSQMVKRDIPIMILASLLLSALLWDGGLGLIDGMILSSLLLGYLIMSYLKADTQTPSDVGATDTTPSWQSMAIIVVGIAMLVGGGILFVDGAVELATVLGISQVVIGLTVVAIGTSMPELATSVVAARRGKSDIAIGNVVGSNLFNILGILGVTALIAPISSQSLSTLDLIVMLMLAAILLPFAWTGYRIGRREGSLLLVCYLAYISHLVLNA